MNTMDGEWTPELQRWVDDGPSPDELPDPVFDAVMERVPTIGQRRHAWPPASVPSFNLMARVGFAAAVVVLAVWAATNAPRGFDFGGPGPSVTASDAEAAVRQTLRYWSGREMPAGTYFVDEPFPMRISFTAPTGVVGSQVVSGLAGLCSGPCDPEIAGLDFWDVDNGYADACAGTILDPPIGPGVDDFVGYLRSVERLTVGTTTDVTIDGHQGVYLETVTDGDLSECQNGLLQLFLNRDGGIYARRAPEGGVDRLWVLDVEGRRLVIDVFSAPEATEAQIADLVAIVESIHVEELYPPSTPTN
ncbi:MAG TPA: hypothetical protein VJ975_08165 [Candidatus Limnocylindria bacterium]|nr:hypothetical protein [Candidatus Limnocylindria bacterium]